MRQARGAQHLDGLAADRALLAGHERRSDRTGIPADRCPDAVADRLADQCQICGRFRRQRGFGPIRDSAGIHRRSRGAIEIPDCAYAFEVGAEREVVETRESRPGGRRQTRLAFDDSSDRKRFVTAPRQQRRPFRRPAQPRAGCFLYANEITPASPVVGIPGEDRSANGRRHGSVENDRIVPRCFDRGKQHARRKESGRDQQRPPASQVSPAKHRRYAENAKQRCKFGNSDGFGHCEPCKRAKRKHDRDQDEAVAVFLLFRNCSAYAEGNRRGRRAHPTANVCRMPARRRPAAGADGGQIASENPRALAPGPRAALPIAHDRSCPALPHSAPPAPVFSILQPTAQSCNSKADAQK